MYEQINRALDKVERKNPGYEEFSAIMNRYARGEIGLNEVYYDLVEAELIPMPQRCGMSAKRTPTPEDELCLKEKIENKLH